MIPPTSEVLFRALVEISADGIALVDREARILYVNPSVTRILGYSPEELLHRVGFDFVAPEDVEEARRQFARCLESRGMPVVLQCRARHRDGITLVIEVIFENHLADPGIDGIIVNFSDVSDRRSIQEELQRSLSLLQATLESTTDGILVVDRAGKFVSYNQKFARMWRIPEEILASGDDHKAIEFVLNQLERPDQFVAKVQELYAQPDAESFDLLTFRDRRIFERYSQPQRIEGRSVGRVWSFRDVTRRRRAERIQLATFRISEASQSTATLDDFFLAIHQIVADLMPAERFTVASFDEPGEVLRFPYHAGGHGPPPEPRPEGRGLLEYVLRTGTALLASPEVVEMLRAAGEIGDADVARSGWLAAPMKSRDRTTGALVVECFSEGDGYRADDREALVFIARQVEMAIERRRSDEELRLFAHTIASISEAASISDLNDRLTFVNDAFCRTYGYTREEILGKRVSLLWSPRNAPGRGPEILRAARAGRWQGEVLNLRKDGTEFPVELSTSPIRNPEGRAMGLVGIARDISERRHSENVQAALYRIVETSVSAEDFPAFYAEIHRIVGQLLDARNFYIALEEPDSGRLRLAYYVDLVDTDQPEMISPRGLTGYVLRTGQPQLILPERFAELVAAGEVDLIGEPSLDWLGVPLRTREKCFGALVVQTYSSDVRYTEADRELLTFVSHNIAAAIERRRAEEALTSANEFRQRVMESTTNAIFALDRSGRFALVNRRTAEITGFSAEELLGSELSRIHSPRVAPAMNDLLHRTMLQGVGVSQFEVEIQRKDGATVTVSLSLSPLLHDGRVAGAVGTAEDITDRKRAGEQIEHLAFHDALTGLPNRLLLRDRLDVAVSRANRSGQPLAVLFLDLDRFKVVNDSLGHDTGDLLLQSASRRLSALVRDSDTIARLGGDEFVIVLSEIKRPEDVVAFARKILESLRESFTIKGQELYISTSIGVSIYPNDGRTGDTLIKNADAAMYRAKEQGRDSYQLFSEALSLRASDRLDLETRLRQALDLEQFEIHYQPIVNLASWQIDGVEALLRWRHPERGLVSPSIFIPVAEENGLILPIGAWVLKEACRQAQIWRTTGHPNLALSVNLSARQLRQQDLVVEVERTLRETGLDPKALSLEITESVAIGNPETSLQTLEGLKALGLHLTMDDFGTGYSSLGVLRSLPFDTLKIDQSFTREIPGNDHDAAIAKSIIRMGHVLNLKVVAEGVETREQLEFLGYHRCDQVQGYYFSRPLPAKSLADLLHNTGWGP